MSAGLIKGWVDFAFDRLVQLNGEDTRCRPAGPEDLRREPSGGEEGSGCIWAGPESLHTLSQFLYPRLSDF